MNTFETFSRMSSQSQADECADMRSRITRIAGNLERLAYRVNLAAASPAHAALWSTATAR